METQSFSGLKDIYEGLRTGSFEEVESQAVQYQDQVLTPDEVYDILLCTVFWRGKREQAVAFADEEARGDFFIREYRGFLRRFQGRFRTGFEEGLYALRSFVFRAALDAYQAALEAAKRSMPELTLKCAKCLKGIGDFHQALELLESLVQNHKDLAEAWSELGDCLDMIGESRKAKLFFREAFFINPQKVDLDFIESRMLRKVLEDLKVRYSDENLLKEWLPIHAVLLGAFNIKRELKATELAQLKQSIYSLRNELQHVDKKSSVLLPRLINRYFWLVDHYVSVKEDREKIEEALLNIRVLDPLIHKQYVS